MGKVTMRGYFEGQPCEADGTTVDKVRKMNDLAKGDVIFSATAITDGSLLQGVHYPCGNQLTHSLLTCSASGITRWVKTKRGN